MTFLQPFILWALPLVLVPVIIHLINRLRHRPQPWAAMRFLVSATRSSISHARLRQYLVLLFRVLAVLALILFLSRPLAGGWLGWALSPAPDAILLLLDRSASMETQLPGANTTRREQALKLLSEAAAGFQGASHVVLIDSALRMPQEVANLARLRELAFAQATETAADFPAMMQTALQWLIENRAGTAEIWIASDLQASNWQPSDPRWKSVSSQLAALPQKVRVRLLSFGNAGSGNTSVALREAVRRPKAEKGELQFVLDLLRTGAGAEKVPLTFTLDGVSAQQEIGMESASMRWRQRAELGAKQGSGWGSFTLPADANGRDNTAWFVYGPETPLRATVVSADAASGRLLQLAASALTRHADARLFTPATFSTAELTDSTLVLWQGPLPDDAAAERLRTFAREGGAVLFLASGSAAAQRFNGVAWGEVQTAEAEKQFNVIRWDEEQGPLARSDEGVSLPLHQVSIARRQLILAPQASLAVLAPFSDGTPFLVRQTLGRGEVYFLASLPNRDWSTLGDGPVLVPMLQRLLQAGSRRVQQASFLTCGELSPAETSKTWTVVDGGGNKDIRLQAGVYRSGERLAAVNRPAAEDEPESIESSQAQQLFGSLPFQMLQEKRGNTDALQGEIWRVLLFGMLIFLLVEGLLVLPTRPAAVPNSTSARRPAAPVEAEVVR